jgi:hypothetical protein
MEWIVLLIIIIYIASKVAKSASKGANPKSENNKNTESAI